MRAGGPAGRPASKDSRGEGRRWVKLGALVLTVLVLPLLVMIAFYASLNVVPTYSPLFDIGRLGQNGLGFPKVITSTSGNTTLTSLLNQTGTLSQPNYFVFDLPRIPSSYVVVVIIVLFLIVSLGIVRNLRSSSRTALEFAALEESEKRKTVIAEVLDATVSKLKAGESYRHTVLECYRLITAILEGKASIEGASLTAREFEELVSKSLKIDSPYLTQMTELFEVARYSDKEISRSQADSATECLSNISQLLRG